MPIKLGTIVTDKITGFRGVAISRTEFIHGCARVAVQPQQLHEGKVIEAGYFDELQLVEYVPDLAVPEKGGPQPCAPARSCPTR